jgi:hypothetical protein
MIKITISGDHKTFQRGLEFAKSATRRGRFDPSTKVWTCEGLPPVFTVDGTEIRLGHERYAEILYRSYGAELLSWSE